MAATSDHPHTGREALLQAAVAVVAERGLEAASVRRIAEAAGVHNTLVTHHYGSREALIAAAIDWVLERQLSIVDVSIDLALDPAARGRLVNEVQADPAQQVFLFEVILAGHRRPEFRDRAQALYDGYVRRTQASLKRHELPADLALARAVFASIDGLVLQQLAVATPRQVDASLARLGDLLSALR